MAVGTLERPIELLIVIAAKLIMVQLTTEQGIFITNKNKVFSTPSQDVDMLRKRIRDTFDELRQQPDILCV